MAAHNAKTCARGKEISRKVLKVGSPLFAIAHRLRLVGLRVFAGGTRRTQSRSRVGDHHLRQYGCYRYAVCRCVSI